MARKLDTTTRPMAASLGAAMLAVFAVLAGLDCARVRSAAALDEEMVLRVRDILEAD
jgi:hypothetical protein